MLISEQAKSLCNLLEDSKAEDVVLIPVGEKTIVADYFIVCTGRSSTHIKALCDEASDRCGELGLELLRTEGYDSAQWVVLDFASILLHIFSPEERKYYNIERLWRDAEN